MNYMGLLDAHSLETNLFFLHRRVLVNVRLSFKTCKLSSAFYANFGEVWGVAAVPVTSAPPATAASDPSSGLSAVPRLA
jgi:hypothetical protein